MKVKLKKSKKPPAPLVAEQVRKCPKIIKIEIAKESPPVISWFDKDGWMQREKITYRSLKNHKIKHRLLVLVLSLLMDILFDSDT